MIKANNHIYVRRRLEDKIWKYINSPEIIAIVGPRQSGKTTLLLRIFEKLNQKKNKVDFLSFEDKKILSIFEEDIDTFVELYVQGKKYLFIDEFQYAKNGGKKLKYIFDSHKIKIFISGSSSIDLTVKALKFLVGRIFIFELYPFDFEEFLDYKDANYLRLLKKFKQRFKKLLPVKINNDIHSQFIRYYDEFTIFGGYPRVVTAKDYEEKKEVLKNIFNTYFAREVKDILGLIDDYKLLKLIKGLALQVGNLIEYSELSNLSELSYPTLKKYLNFFEKTFVCNLVKPFFKNKRTEIVKNPKIYFFDTGLRNAVIEDFRGLDSRPDEGGLLENAVFQEMIKNGEKINYWRTKERQEIDFILTKENQEYLAVEVKNRLSKAKSSSLKRFQKLYPEIKVVFVYRHSGEKPSTTRELAYPIYLF